MTVLLELEPHKVCLPLHGEESVGHVVFLPLAPVKLLCEHVSHGALQQVRHLDVPISVKNSVQSFPNATEAVEGQSSHAQPEDANNKVKRLSTHNAGRKKYTQAKHPCLHLIMLIMCRL